MKDWQYPEDKDEKDPLQSREFYELMQRYRTFTGAIHSGHMYLFNDIKVFIRNHFEEEKA